MCQKNDFKLVGNVLWKGKNEWLFTSKNNYFAEHIDMNQVKKLGPNYSTAVFDATWKYGDDFTIVTENTPQV